MSAFWDVKHKGFSTIVLIGLLSFTTSVASLMVVRLQQFKLLKQWDVSKEMREIKIVKQIKTCYYKQNCEDHEEEILGMPVEFRFLDLEAEVICGDGLVYRFTYDEPFLCIGSMDIVSP